MTALSLPDQLGPSPAEVLSAVRRWLAGPLRLCSVISSLWTTALLATVPLAPARALDLDSTGDRSDETVAYRERLKDYDSIKKYGAERVADRERKPFQPEGIRVGSFLFLPTIGTAVVFNDNVLLSNQNRQSDLAAEITPGLRIVSQLPRHVLDMSLSGRIVEHFEHNDLDRAGVQLRANAALHFDHAHTLSMSVLSRLDHTDQLDPLSPTFARQLVSFTQHRASIGLTRDAGRLYGTVSATFESIDFKNVTAHDGTLVDQDDDDTKTFSGELRAGYRFSPGYELVTKFRGLRQLNRGSSKIDRDAYGYEALAGLAAEWSPLLRWRILGGYGSRDFDQADLATVRTMLAEAEVQWLPTQFVTVYGTARRAISDAQGHEQGGLIETALRARVDYEIWHNVVLSLNGEFKDHDFLDSNRRDHILSGRIGIEWLMSKNWHFNIAYEHLVRDSNTPENDLTRNMVTVGAKLRF
jgi:hypothetical protein